MKIRECCGKCFFSENCPFGQVKLLCGEIFAKANVKCTLREEYGQMEIYRGKIVEKKFRGILKNPPKTPKLLNRFLKINPAQIVMFD